MRSTAWTCVPRCLPAIAISRRCATIFRWCLARRRRRERLASLSALFDRRWRRRRRTPTPSASGSRAAARAGDPRAAAPAAPPARSTVLWDLAVSRLAPKRDPAFVDSCTRLRAAIEVDGELARLRRGPAGARAAGTYGAGPGREGRRVRPKLERLMLKLGDILKPTSSAPPAASAPSGCKASMGAAHAPMFDFDVMSRYLAKAQPARAMPDARRGRIRPCWTS